MNTDKIPAKLEAFKVTSKKPRHRADREENDEVRCARCFQKTFCDVHLQYPIGSTDGTYIHLHWTIKINQIYLVIQSDLFGMVKWPFEGVKWPPTGGWKGHFESPGPGTYPCIQCSHQPVGSCGGLLRCWPISVPPWVNKTSGIQKSSVKSAIFCGVENLFSTFQISGFGMVTCPFLLQVPFCLLF